MYREKKYGPDDFTEEGKGAYAAALEGTAAGRYVPGRNDAEYGRLVDYVKNMNYGSFTRGADRKALADRYARAGERAMDDTLGKVSARTGGLASSYAESAAQQRYNDFMAGLEEAAQSLYESRRSEAIKNAELAKGLADRDYDRATADRDFRRSVYNDLLGYAYKDQASAEKEKTSARDDARDRIYYLLAKAGSPAEDIDPELLKASGLTAAELAAYSREYRGR